MIRKAFYLSGNLLAAVTGAGLLARYIPPDVWWPPAVIALLLPGLLFLTVLFALWMLYKRRWSVATFPVIILVAATPLLGRIFAFGAGSSPKSETTVTLLTANVRGFKDAAWKRIGIDKSVAFLKRQSPDILLLQEALAGEFVDPVRAASGLNKRHQPNRKTIATYANDVTFIDDVFRGKKNFNGFLVTDVETSIGTIRVINVHLQSNQISGMAGKIGQDNDLGQEIDRAESMFRRYGASAAIRVEQAEAIRKFVNDSPYPVIVGGDFNDVPSSYTYQRILTNRLNDAWSAQGFGIGTTFTGPLPFLRIDFLLVDKSLTVHSIERIETGYSDHRGVKVVIGK